jgi:hypothetical protein
MTITMILDAVTATHYLAYQLGKACGTLRHTEEAGLRIVTIEHLEHTRRYVRIGTIIKSKSDTAVA